MFQSARVSAPTRTAVPHLSPLRTDQRPKAPGPRASPATILPWLAAVILSAGPAGDRPARALDPTRAVTQYGNQIWTGRTGLPGEAVYDITQSPDGYLWL